MSNSPLRNQLKAVAKETCSIVPKLLRELQTEKDAEKLEKYSTTSLYYTTPLLLLLHSRPVTIEVTNEDTLNAATRLIELSKRYHSHTQSRPAVLNFANSRKPGGR